MNRREFVRFAGSQAFLAAALAERVSAAESPLPKIRIGQIGTAHAHAAGKMGAIRNLAHTYEVVGIVEPDPDRRSAAQHLPIYAGLKWMTEEELLNSPGLQAVAIETEVCDLLATASRAVRAGKHIHLDKPAGESLRAFRDVLHQAALKKLTVQMGYMFRYNPAFQLCYRAVQEGWLGRIFSVDTVIGKVLDSESRRELVRYPGGAMFELGCHVIDSVVRILGRPLQVTAFNRRSPWANDGLADNQLAVLEYPDATATVRASFVEVEGMARRQFVVCGEKGTLDIRPLEPPHVRMALNEPREQFRKGYQDVPMARMPRYDGEFIDLAKVIRGEKQFEWPAGHDLAVQETVLRASGLEAEGG